MYELKILSQFAAAHQLREFHGGCERLHGHNWKIEVFVKGEDLGKDGLLVDFKEIKTETNRILDELDHRFLNDLEPFVDVNPSSENIACYIFKSLSAKMGNERVKISKVTAWESDSACASYYE